LSKASLVGWMGNVLLDP